MHYHVARDGQQLGQISEEDLRAGLFDGRYLTTDLAWKEGMAQWTPLGELLGAPRAAVARRQPSGPGSISSAPLGEPPRSGLALTSLIFGILSFLLCGLGGVGTLVAIICGHRALSRINRSGGAEGGRGMALAGLILGYVSIFSTITGVAVGASMAVPVFAKVQEKGQITKQISNARQIQLACLLYAAENDGRYPDTLEELEANGALEPGKLKALNGLKPSSWRGEPGFEYLGKGMDDTTLAETEILVSRAQSKGGDRVVAFHDGSVRLVSSSK